MNRYISVDVEVNLSDIDISDLIDELKERGAGDEIPLRKIITTLKERGCPEDLVNLLDEWASQPLLDNKKMEEWRRLAL